LKTFTSRWSAISRKSSINGYRTRCWNRIEASRALILCHNPENRTRVILSAIAKDLLFSRSRIESALCSETKKSKSRFLVAEFILSTAEGLARMTL
jgi:hypothetical protein